MGRQPAEGPRFSTPEERRKADRARHRRVLVLEVVVTLMVGFALLVLFLVVVPEDDDEGEESRADGRDHSSITACEPGPDGSFEAEVTVTNDSSEYSDYLIEVVFEAPDGTEVDRRNVSVRGVLAGATETKRTQARGTSSDDLTCRIDAAFRLFAGAAPRP